MATNSSLLLPLGGRVSFLFLDSRLARDCFDQQSTAGRCHASSGPAFQRTSSSHHALPELKPPRKTSAHSAGRATYRGPESTRREGGAWQSPAFQPSPPKVPGMWIKLSCEVKQTSLATRWMPLCDTTQCHLEQKNHPAKPFLNSWPIHLLGRRELNLVAICCAAIATQYHIKDCNVGNSTTDNRETLLERKPLGYLPSFLLR